jgi:NADPH:quinone reductase-like Zn-dependent oxidoreductase
MLEVVDLPDREAGPGEMRIRVRAAAVNPADIGLRSGVRAAMMKAANPPPYVPGMDAAGVLERIGEGVSTDLKVGDDVMAVVVPFGSHGAYSERIVVPAKSVARMPAGATYAEAASLPMNALTARLALDLLALQPGDTLAVTGAAGAVGGYAVQLGKAEGLRIIADAFEADEKLVTDLGADIVVRRGPDFAERVREAVPEGVDGVIDGAVVNELVVPAVRDGGRIATLRGFQGNGERGITFFPVFVPNYARQQAKLDRLRQQVEAGEVSLRVAGTLPAEQAARAHRIVEGGGTRGRLILEPLDLNSGVTQQCSHEGGFRANDIRASESWRSLSSNRPVSHRETWR